MKLTDKELIEQLQERLDNSNRSRAEAISLAIRKQARAEKAEAERDAAVDAIEYVLDGYGLNAPDFKRQRGDVEDDWIIERLRDTIAKIKEGKL